MITRAFMLSKGYAVTAVAAGGDLTQVERKQRRGGWKTKENGQHGHPNQQSSHMEQRTVVIIVCRRRRRLSFHLPCAGRPLLTGLIAHPTVPIANGVPPLASLDVCCESWLVLPCNLQLVRYTICRQVYLDGL